MLDIEHVGGGYDLGTVLHDVSISVPSGSVVALLGPNGAGKSTTMKMVSGLLRPDRGRVVLDGDDVTHLGADQRARRGICHVMEGRGIFPSLSVKENLRIQSCRGMPSSEILERTNDGFPRLTERLQQQAGTLSGGEQQMVALMRAYLSSPRVVLVDEASLGLAPIVVDQIFEFLTRLARDGVSLLIVEQYVTRALEVASFVYVLSRGRVVHSGPAADLDEDSIFSLYAQQPEPRPA